MPSNNKKWMRDRNARLVQEWKRQGKCVNCGNNDYRVLEFSHRDPTTKKGNIADLASRPVGVTTLTEEMKKCDLECANCHRIKTYKENGYRLFD